MTKEEVRRIRKRLKLTQAKFAKELGVHRITVVRWEAGAHPVEGPAVKLIRLMKKGGR